MVRTDPPISYRIARGLAVALLIAGMVSIPAATGGADPGDEVTIAMRALHFEQAVTQITTGTTVIFKNDEVFDYPALDGTHRIVSSDRSWDSGDIAPSAAWSVDVLMPGDIDFYCTIHPTLMTGTLVVTGDEIKPEPTKKTVKIVEGSSSDTDTWGYDPDEILVDAGTTITWRNEGAQVHTVTSDDGSFDSGNLQPGQSYTRTFDKPTALRYHCDPHPWMVGLVQVAGKGGTPPPPPPTDGGGAGGGPTVDIPTGQPARSGDGPATFDVSVIEGSISDPDSWGFAPPELTARVGDTVVWTNRGSIGHTVTDTAGAFDSGELAAGDTFELELTQTGTISYKCTPHPWMAATVIVQEAGAPVPQQPVTGPGTGGPTDPSTEEPAGGEEPGEHGEEGAALDPQRVAFAGATSGAILLLGLLVMLPSLIGRKRTPPPAEQPPAHETIEAPDRELAGV